MKTRILTAPFAICSDGSLVVNIHCYASDADPKRLLELALHDKAMLFIGTRLRADEVRDVLGRLDDACFEAAGFALGRRNRSRRLRVARASKKGGA